MTNNYVLLNGELSRDIEVSKNDKGHSFVKFCLICTEMVLIHIQIILTVSHLEKLRMPSVEKEKRIQLIILKEISEQTHMRKMVKRIIPQMWL